MILAPARDRCSTVQGDDVHNVTTAATLPTRQHSDVSSALDAWRAELNLAAQVARDNEARAVELARQADRARSDDDLLHRRWECLYWTVFRNYDNDDIEAVFQAGNRRELGAVERELRKRLSRLNAAIQPKDGARPRTAGEDLTDVKRRVKEILTVPDVLVDLGFEPKRTGTSGGREEWHSRCPFCGDGDDRLISWGHPESNFYCRRCGTGGDVIDLVENVLQVGFREATLRLARLAGLSA